MSMNTTPLRIEILILGFQASVWLVVFLGLSVNDIGEAILKWKEVSLIVALVVFGFCYTMGSLVDSISGSIEIIFRKLVFKKEKNQHNSRFWLDHVEAAGQINARYFDVRVMRGTVFNILFLVMALVYSKSQCWVILMSSLIFLLTFYSWLLRKSILSERLEKLCEEVDSKNNY